MNRILAGTSAVALSLALIGCSDNGSSLSTTDNNGNDGNDDTQDTASTVDFTSFVKSEIANTAEGRDAVPINDIEFSFNDQDNEAAFTDLF